MNVHWVDFFFFHLNVLRQFFALSAVIIARAPGAGASYHYHDKFQSTYGDPQQPLM